MKRFLALGAFMLLATKAFAFFPFAPLPTISFDLNKVDEMGINEIIQVIKNSLIPTLFGGSEAPQLDAVALPLEGVLPAKKNYNFIKDREVDEKALQDWKTEELTRVLVLPEPVKIESPLILPFRDTEEDVIGLRTQVLKMQMNIGRLLTETNELMGIRARLLGEIAKHSW